MSVDQASADMAVVAKRFATVYPEDHPKDAVFEVEALIDSSVKGFGSAYYVLMAAGVLILLIACANVANILLARATEREKEFAVRAALGASRVRLVHQMMIESLLLALSGGTVGCWLAWNGLGALVGIIPARFEERGELAIGINGPVLLFTLATVLISTLLSGSAPALLAAGRDLQAPLKAGGRGSGETSRRHRLRNLLVVSEVALSLVLLSGAGLLTPKFLGLLEFRLGYNLGRTLSVLVGLPESQYNIPEKRIQFQLDFLRSMRATPGVAAATLNSPPVPWEGLDTAVQIAGKPVAEDQRAHFSRVGDRFFELVDIHLLQGRGVSEQDLNQRRMVAVINRAFEDAILPGRTR